ncbi:MAG: hypothetical protein HY314_17445 [Acidobacteria bacterium]|nr:hypothetical protein [Acidobacteriota bacterium]
MGKTREKEFEYELTHQDRIRERIHTHPAPDADWTYALQLECLFGDKWHAVIRYDDAHGRPHIDELHPDGRKNKRWLPYKGRHQSISEARSALMNNFERQRERYQKELQEYEQSPGN